MSATPSAWSCRICHTRYGVPSLAADCEAKCREAQWAMFGQGVRTEVDE